MAYIATKALYTGTEEYKEEGTNVIKKRIVTDVDDVVFETGEVIVLIEEENRDQHFDLSIEDKGSMYFRPTQIKIGDGFHSFKELNWIQTFDPSRVTNAVSQGVTQATEKIMSEFSGLEARIEKFINTDASVILRELVKGKYFTLSEDGVLSSFNTAGVSINELKSLSVGYNNTFNIDGNIGKRCVAFGRDNKTSGSCNFINGINNIVQNNSISIVNGAGNEIINDNDIEHDKYYNTCLGYRNKIKNGDANFVSGYNNEILGFYNVCFGNSNDTYVDGLKSGEKNAGQYNFTFGSDNELIGDIHGFSQKYNVCFGKENKISGTYNFTCGSNNTIKNRTYSFSFGSNNKVLGDYDFNFGNNNSILGDYGFVGGHSSYANSYSIAYGRGINSPIAGTSGTAGVYSAGFGSFNNTKGSFSFSCGSYNNSNGNYSFTAGINNVVDGESSFACGLGNEASNTSSFACGQYNDGTNKLFSIGNGTDEENRSNVFDIDTNGKATFYGDLEVKGKISGFGKQLLGNSRGFNITSIENLYELVSPASIEGGVIVGNPTIFEPGIYEVIIIPLDQQIKSVKTALHTDGIPINQSYQMHYNTLTSDTFMFELKEDATRALVYISIIKTSNYGESQ